MDGGLFERLRRVDHRIWDGLITLVVVLASLAAFLTAHASVNQDYRLLGTGLVIAACLPLAWRRRAPLVVAIVVGAAVAAFSLVGYEPPLWLPLVIAAYTAAAYRERDRLAPVLVLLAVAAAITTSWTEGPVRAGGVNWAEILVGVFVGVGIPATLGRMTFNRRRRILRDRDLAAREAVAAERTRIARELHDIVAHHMSVMVVQAGAARAVGATDPGAASEALRQIEASGRTGLAEMRRLLEILKAEDGENGRTPQPGLARLDELLDGMRATGLPVEAVVEGTQRPLPPGVDLSAYRIVQEALTNVLRHAGGASARVLLRYAPEALELEIADDGPGPPEDGARAGGHGLIGMYERAALFGGTLEAGGRPGGGFQVRARLPADAEP